MGDKKIGRGNENNKAIETALCIMGTSDDYVEPPLDREFYNSTFQRIVDYVHDALCERYESPVVAELRSEVEKFQSENAELKEGPKYAKFIERIVRDSWDGCSFEELDGADIQDYAVECGVLMSCPATQEDVDEIMEIEEIGQEVFKFTPAFTKFVDRAVLSKQKGEVDGT